MKVLLVSNQFEQRHIDLIEKKCREVNYSFSFCASEKDIGESDFDADIVFGFAPSIAKTSKKLKWLCIPWAGVDSILVDGYFANSECLLTNSAGAYGVSIAEHMIAQALIMFRRLNEFLDGSRQCQWLSQRSQKSLKGSRVTVLGTGDIGSNFAKRLRAFEPAKITGVCRSGKSSCSFFDQVLPVSKLDQVLADTDLLAMSLPATKETKGILSRQRISIMPSGSYIINVGRGSAIDEDALFEYLETGHIAGAALDVFQKEPIPPQSKIWKVKNLVITPHVAGNLTLDYTKDKAVEMFIEDLTNFANGKELKHLVDKKLGY